MQHCWVSIIEKWKGSVNIGGAYDALMRDFESLWLLRHELLIAKLGAFGFHLRLMKLTQQYHSNKKQV